MATKRADTVVPGDRVVLGSGSYQISRVGRRGKNNVVLEAGNYSLVFPAGAPVTIEGESDAD